MASKTNDQMLRVTGKVAKAIAAELGKRGGDVRARITKQLAGVLNDHPVPAWLVLEHHPLERIVHLGSPAFDVTMRDGDEFWDGCAAPQVVWTGGKATHRAPRRDDEVTALADRDVASITDYETSGDLVLAEIRWHEPPPATKKLFAALLARAERVEDLPSFDPSPAGTGAAGTPIGTAYLAGADRCNAFDGAIAKAPKIKWKAREGGNHEWGGHVVVGEGLAVTGMSSYTCTFSGFDAVTGAKTWAHTIAKTQAWPTSSAAIAGGVVYIASKLGLHALDAKSGRPKWLAKLTGTMGAPLVLGELVVIAAKHGLFALATATGRKVWTFAFKGDPGGFPAARDGVIYVSAGKYLYALDAADGKKVHWKIDTKPASKDRYGANVGPVIAGDRILYAGTIGELYCADRATGKQRWRQQVSLGEHGLAVAHDRIVGKDSAGRLQALDLATGKIVWTADARLRKPSDQGNCGPAIIGDTVVSMMLGHTGGDDDDEDGDELNYLCGFAVATGKLRWTLDASKIFKRRGGWSWHGSPHAADGLLYAHGDDGLVALR